MIVRIAAALAAFVFVSLASPATAATGTIYMFQSNGSSTLTFDVVDMSDPSMPPTTGSATFLLWAATSATSGTITVTAPTVIGSSGVTIPAGAFTAKCTSTMDSGGMFTSKGTVRLSTSAVTCGTLAANKTGELDFTVTLTLDDTADAYVFPADTYTSGSLRVTANVP